MTNGKEAWRDGAGGIIRVFLVCTLWVTPVVAAETPAKEPNDADHQDLTGNFIEAGDFPHSIKIPGSTFSFKFGGYIKLDMINSFDPIGNEDSILMVTEIN
jgi:hypothetical protein